MLKALALGFAASIGLVSGLLIFGGSVAIYGANEIAEKLEHFQVYSLEGMEFKNCAEKAYTVSGDAMQAVNACAAEWKAFKESPVFLDESENMWNSSEMISIIFDEYQHYPS